LASIAACKVTGGYLQSARISQPSIDAPYLGVAYVHSIQLAAAYDLDINTDARAPHAKSVALRSGAQFSRAITRIGKIDFGTPDGTLLPMNKIEQNALSVLIHGDVSICNNWNGWLETLAPSILNTTRVQDAYYENAGTVKDNVRIMMDRSAVSNHINHPLAHHNNQIAEEAYFRTRYSHEIVRAPTCPLNRGGW
jgi:hypothetical protein